MGSGSEWLRKALLKQGVVRRGSHVLSSGKHSDVYFDVKRTFGTQIMLMTYAQELGQDIPRGTIVAGEGFGGTQLAAALCTHAGYNAVYVRETQKNHGLLGVIEGHRFSPGDRTFIVDDVLTTGSSILRIADTLRAHGLEVIGAGVIIARNNVDVGMRVYSLFDATDLL